MTAAVPLMEVMRLVGTVVDYCCVIEFLCLQLYPGGLTNLRTGSANRSDRQRDPTTGNET
ncbi:hypothetical protein BJF87_13715 [Gordonia sp. CNJ-863]|nr:hypothetical protein BJF87_13715 [Gordonia sp. CNJ-863]